MDETTNETLHVRFTKSEVAHEITWLFGRPVIESDADEALNKAMEELPIILSWSETPPPDDYSYSEDEEGY